MILSFMFFLHSQPLTLRRTLLRVDGWDWRYVWELQNEHSVQTGSPINRAFSWVYYVFISINGWTEDHFNPPPPPPDCQYVIT